MHKKLLIHLILHSGKALNELITQKLSAYNLHHGQARIINALNIYGVRSQVEIANGLHIKKATVTVMIQKLEKAGLIVRKNDKLDKRKIMISLSTEGKKAARKVEEVWSSVEAMILDSFEPEQIDDIESYLFLIRDILGGEDPSFNQEKQ